MEGKRGEEEEEGKSSVKRKGQNVGNGKLREEKKGERSVTRNGISEEESGSERGRGRREGWGSR